MSCLSSFVIINSIQNFEFIYFIFLCKCTVCMPWITFRTFVNKHLPKLTYFLIPKCVQFRMVSLYNYRCLELQECPSPTSFQKYYFSGLNIFYLLWYEDNSITLTWQKLNTHIWLDFINHWIFLQFSQSLPFICEMSNQYSVLLLSVLSVSIF